MEEMTKFVLTVVLVMHGISLLIGVGQYFRMQKMEKEVRHGK